MIDFFAFGCFSDDGAVSFKTDEEVPRELEQEDDQAARHSLGKQMTAHVDIACSLVKLLSECTQQAEVTDFEIHLKLSGIIKHSDSNAVSYPVDNVKKELEEELGVRQNTAVEERDDQASRLQTHSLEKQMTAHVDIACSLVKLHSECSQQAEVTDFEVHLKRSGIIQHSDSNAVLYPDVNVKKESEDELGVRQNTAVEVKSQMCSPEEKSVTFGSELTSFSNLKVFRKICGTYRFERKTDISTSSLTEKSKSFEHEGSGKPVSTDNENINMFKEINGSRGDNDMIFEKIIDSRCDNDTINRCESKEPNLNENDISDTVQKQTKEKHGDFIQKLLTDTENVQEQKMKRGRDSHLNIFQTDITSTAIVQEQKMKGDRDSHVKKFQTARSGSENVQEQKRNGDRDTSFNMFVNDKTDTENVQAQKRKGDRDSSLNTFLNDKTGTEIGQEQKRKGDRYSSLNLFLNKKMEGDRDSHLKRFKKAIRGSVKGQEQKRKSDRDSSLNMFVNDKTVTENVQEQERKGDRDSHLKGLRKLEKVPKKCRNRKGMEIETQV